MYVLEGYRYVQYGLLDCTVLPSSETFKITLFLCSYRTLILHSQNPLHLFFKVSIYVYVLLQVLEMWTDMATLIALKAPEIIEQMLNIYLLKSKSNSQNEITFQPYCLCLFVDTCLFFSYYRNNDISHWLIHLLNSN